MQIGETAHLTLVVGQVDVDKIGHGHLLRVEFPLGVLSLDDALCLLSLDGDVVQVLATGGARVELVPAGGHGGKGLHVVGIAAGIEHHEVAVAHHDALEEGEIAVGAHGLAVDIVAAHVFLIGCHDALYAVLHGLRIEVGRLQDALGAGLQVHLLEGKFLDLEAVVAALHLIL